MPPLFADSGFWIGLGQIVLVNLILSGDNAVVIALAARSLPEAQRRQAVVWGSVGAVAMRVILTLAAVEMLKLPWLKIIGSGLLFWIALQLLLPEHEDGKGIDSHDGLFAAIRTILLADLVMSLDNVIAVAGAARGNTPLLVIGLGLSIPLVIFGSTLILRIMDRFPVIVILGAALLGLVSGEMLVGDPALQPWLDQDWLQPYGPWIEEGIPIAAAVLVVTLGKLLARRAAAVPGPMVDLAADDTESRPGGVG